MRYDLKIKIGETELLEAPDITITENVPSAEPQIANVRLTNSACSGTMEIGAVASDMLQFDILHPYKSTFDGEKAILYVREQESTEQSAISLIEEDVGDDITSDVLSREGEAVTEDFAEEEADIDAEDEADAEEVDAALQAGLETLLEGEVPEDEAEDESEDTGSEWDPVGVFFVYSQTDNQDKSVHLVCYDGFSQMTGFYTPTNRRTTIGSLFADLRAKVRDLCGVTIDEFDFGDYEDTLITWSIVCSYREALGYFAGIAGGFAEFMPDGTVGISQYSFDDNNLIYEELISYKESSAGEMVVESISCNRAPGELQEDIIESGSGGQSLYFNNPFVTQEMLDDMLEDYQGIRFTGAQIGASWDKAMTAGEFVRIFTKAEWENYLLLKNNVEQNGSTMGADELARLKAGMNDLGRIALISTQTITFQGEASTVITSICDSEAQKANTPLGPTDAKFRKVYAEVVETKELVAEKASIGDLDAAKATLGEAIIGSGSADTFVAAKLTFDEAIAGKFTAEQITALDAAFDSVTAEEISVGTVSGAVGSFKELLAGSFSADEISAATAAFETSVINQLYVESMRAKYAQIDFANVGTAMINQEWVQDLFVRGGFVANDGTVFRLTGVHISGDLIDANTIRADALLLQGQNGLYYKINVDELGKATADSDPKYQKGIDGSAIIAHSITANEITTQNIRGTGGWINFAAGTFAYVNAQNGHGIVWDGTNLTINTDRLTIGDVDMSEAVQSALDAAEAVTGMQDRMDSGEFRGEDAVVLRIDSSRGTVFKNNMIQTVLTVTIYSGGDRITNAAQLHAKFGNAAYLQWYWLRLDDDEYGIIPASDSKLSDSGFTMILTPATVDTKVTFRCELITGD